jgi:uncharacterized protein YeaO (DUF488 family)
LIVLIQPPLKNKQHCFREDRPMTEVKHSNIKVKRIYEPPSPDDGVRILVDRFWPRGMSKERAAIDEWRKDIAPSPELCKWFGHRPERFEEFQARYERELEENPMSLAFADQIHELANEKTVTLLYAAKDPVLNQAVVLERWLKRRNTGIHADQ